MPTYQDTGRRMGMNRGKDSFLIKFKIPTYLQVGVMLPHSYLPNYIKNGEIRHEILNL